MRYYSFNIGKPYIDEWWAQNLQHNVITAGYDGESGDRGDVILNQLSENDWVIAYANGYGFIGAGLVGASNTYRLMDDEEVLPEWKSPHRHVRQIKWAYAVPSLSLAVRVTDVNHHAPRQTKELLPPNIGNLLIGSLASQALDATSTNLITKIQSEFDAQIQNSLKNPRVARLNRLAQAAKFPTRISALAHVFIRNPDVVAETLHLSKGKCQRCKSNAPFNRRSDGAPYLEVHHKKSLAYGGEDTVENTIALCPNCHRYLHYGQI